MEDISRIDAFDDLIRSALRDEYAASPELVDGLLGELRHGGWRPRPFVDAFRKGAAYPEDRLLGCLYKIIDVKLQFYFLLEVDLPLYNSQVYDFGFTRELAGSMPHLLLRHLSIDQTVIVKARILWERVMNFIYFLETGEDLENKRSGSRSKRSIFWKFVEANPKWIFLHPYSAELDHFDQKYRGPEVHKASKLRAHLLLGEVPSAEELLKPVNRAMNTIWPNVLLVVAGQGASMFTDLHLGQDGVTVDPKYYPRHVVPKE